MNHRHPVPWKVPQQATKPVALTAAESGTSSTSDQARPGSPRVGNSSKMCSPGVYYEGREFVAHRADELDINVLLETVEALGARPRRGHLAAESGKRAIRMKRLARQESGESDGAQ